MLQELYVLQDLRLKMLAVLALSFTSRVANSLGANFRTQQCQKNHLPHGIS